uniref:Uncharacterized protein n=1 Tax=Plectus sambesii TaxID=2011161 RepID=A0A914VXR0_9BILA
MDYLNDFDQQLQLMAKRLPELEQKARTLKEIVKRHRNVNDERIQLNTFGWMILWIPVRDALHKRIDKEKKLEKAKDALEKLDAEVDSITADKNKVEEEKAAAIAEIEELSGPTSSVAAQVTEKKQQVRVAFQRFKQAESQARDKNNEVRCRAQEMVTVRKQLDKLLESGPSQTKDAAQKIQEDIERNEQEMLAASNGAEVAEEEVRRLQLSEQQFQGKLAKIRGDVDHWQREIRFREEKLRAEKRSAQSGAAKFGEKMPDLQALIASETRFARKPVGPLGQYVKVRDEKWALAVELAIKPETLGAFACDNFKDSALLRQLVGRCRWSGRTPAIIVSKFKDTPYNTSAHEPPTQFETVLRQIEVSDPVVYNTLIDQTKIESILLINSDQEARTLMQSNPPPNAAKGFTLSGAEVFASGRGKQYRFYANQHSAQQAQYLRAGGGRDSSRELHGEIAEFKRLLQEQRPQIDQIEKQLQVATRELRAASDQLRRANDNLPRIERDGRDLKRQLDKLLAQASSNNTEILREEFSKLQLLHDEAVKAAKEAKKAADEGETAFEEAQEEEKMAEQKLTAAKKRIEPFHAQLTKFEADLATLESQLQVNIAKRTKVDQIRQRFDEEVGALQAQHDQCYEQAINSEMPVPDGWTVPPDLDALPDTQETTDRYTQLEQRLLAAQQALGDPMEDKNKYDEAVARYRDNKLVHKQLHKIHQQLMSRLKHREEKYRLVRSSMSLRLKLSFMRLMNMRQFGGKIDYMKERQPIDAADGLFCCRAVIVAAVLGNVTMYSVVVFSVLAAVVSGAARANQQATSGGQSVLYGDLPAELHVGVDEVGGGNYSYYSINAAGYVTILLDSLKGDADLYVSSRRKEPRFALDSHEYHSTTCGIDRVDIGHLVPRPLYVAVYGHPSNEVTRYRLLVLAIQVTEKEKLEYAEAPDVPDELIREIGLLEDDGETTNNFGEILLKLLRFLVELAVEILL